MKKRLISSYDEINDTFVGKIDGEDGFCADFDISNGIFLGVKSGISSSGKVICILSPAFSLADFLTSFPLTKIRPFSKRFISA